jgi:adenine deaminase
MILDDLTAFPPKAVYAHGQQVAEDGKLTITMEAATYPVPDYPRLPSEIRRDQLRVTEPGDHRHLALPVVTLQNQKTTLTQLESVDVQLSDGYANFTDGDDLALAAIFARNDASHFVGVIKNTGIAAGAIATTVAHDSHNLLIIGRDVQSVQTAANRVRELDGGVVVADGDHILAELHLPYFGLLSDAEVADVAADLAAIEDSLRALGVTRARPFLTFSIMGLTVSPYAKFTDRGIVETESRTLVDMRL